MQKTKFKSLFLKACAVLSIFTLASCTASEPLDPQTHKIYETKFHKPLTLEQTPKTDIAYDKEGKSWPEFKAFLIEEAKKQGFSTRIIAQLSQLNFTPKVIRFDQNQYERILEQKRKREANQGNANNNPPPPPKEKSLMDNYISNHINSYKVERAKALVANYDYSLQKFSKRFGVPPEVIVGLWGMETNFGQYTGKYNLLDSLASLAYEGRRRQFFTREFFNALRVMEINNFDKKEMLSSWAGAVGQIQFMPTSYLLYAVDGNEDGQTNIWISTIDSLASIASYLHTEGWDPKLPWGLPIANMTFANYLENKDTFINDYKARPFKEWKAMGYKLSPEASKVMNYANVNDNTPLYMVVPTDEPTMAHLVTKNYFVYMHWNRSMYFAFANGTFADRIWQLGQDTKKK